MPAQPRERKISFEPDVDVDRFNLATDSMARVVRRVRGEDPGPPVRPRRRQRRARVSGHPSAAGRSSPLRATAALPRISPFPEAPSTVAHRRRMVLLGAALVLVVLGAIVATAGSPDDEPAATAPTTDPPAATESGPAPTEPPAAPPAVTVTHPDAQRVEVRAPRAQLTVEASGQCWLRVVRDGDDGADLVVGAGDRQAFEAAERVELRIGNPGAVAIEVAGTPVDLGDHGGRPVDLVLLAE